MVTLVFKNSSSKTTSYGSSKFCHVSLSAAQILPMIGFDQSAGWVPKAEAQP